MSFIRALIPTLLLLVLYFSNPVYSSASGSNHNTGVCTSARSALSSSTLYRSSSYTVSQRSTYGCGFLWLSRCSRYSTRYVYYAVSYASYFVTYYSVSVCCPGYQSIAGQCKPVCSQGCVNGRCTSPNVCSCFSGWTGSSCQTDVNECDLNYCSHYCVNTPGYYSCSCPSNYYLSYDWHTCIDINECTNGQVTTGLLTGPEHNSSSGLPDDWCEQKCVNTPGSYSCDCINGYQLDANNQTCSDIDECLYDNGGCNHTCNNSIGSYECICDSGYILLEDKHSCADHCECCTEDDDCEQICHNTIGSYNCSCLSGYRVSSTNSSACQDINECIEGTSNCDQICINELGSYSCTCRQGFILLEIDNSTCQDINECNHTNGGCAHNCINTQGSHYCTCNSGYMLGSDGTSCEDINECVKNTSNCTQICSNNVGGYTCGCLIGYNLKEDYTTCEDINECIQGNGGCQHTCVNTLGSYTCQCRPGYAKNNYLCTALSCSLLTPPPNGHMTCSGLQVTDENCTMSCLPGYTLNGSVIRTCLGIDQSWSGEHTTCVRSQCSVLASTNSLSVLYPCFNKYLDSCQLVCQEGYATSKGEFSWTQMCSVSNESSIVDWDSNKTCTVRDKCDPNPCFPGQCTVNMNSNVQCDCTGTYTMGERCQMTQIVTEPVPVLTNGDSFTSQLRSRLGSTSTHILVTSSDNSSLVLPQSMISIGSSQTVHANHPGLYTVKYTSDTSTHFNAPDDSIYLVTPRNQRRQATDYFTLQGQTRGHLGIGCCRSLLDLSPYQCSSNLTLHSYCQWNDGNTEGITHISVHSLYLPLSIAGLTNTFSVFQNGSSGQCLSCDKGSDLQCQVAQPSLHFNSDVISGILGEKSLIISFLNSIKSFLPTWSQIQVYTSTQTQKYSSYDFISFFGSSKDLKLLVGCQDIQLPDSSNMVYGLRTTSHLLFTLNSYPVFLYPTINNPFCIAIDICSHRVPSLHVAIPSVLVSRQNLASMSILRPLLRDDDTQLIFKSIILQENGIDLLLLDTIDSKYWNGSHYFSPSFPPRYEYGINVMLRRTFTSQSDQRLSVQLSYDGLMYYQPNINDAKQVPGLLIGNLTLNITTLINGVNVSLILTSQDRDPPALFSYPTGSAVQSSMSLGLYAGLRYIPQSSSTFYRNHFNVESSSCLVYVSLSVDEYLNINSVSFTSKCLSLQLDAFIFPSNKLQTVAVLPGSHSNEQSNAAMTIKTNLLPIATKSYQVGSFYLHSSDNNASILIIQYKSMATEKKSGTLRNVNISLLDSMFTANVSIIHDLFTFLTDTKIYSNYDVKLLGSVSSCNGSILVEGTFLENPNSFRSDISSYLTEHLHSEVEDVLDRSNHTIESIRISRTWRDTLYDQLIEAQAILPQMKNLVSERNNTFYTKKNEEQEALNELKIALMQYNASLPLNTFLCGSVCDSRNECITGINCLSYSKPLTLNVTGSCSYTVRINAMKQQLNKVSVREWQYITQCESCWKIMWYKSLYLSQTTCCKGIKTPIDTYQYSVQYINATVNDTQKRLCTVDSNSESLQSHHCEVTQCINQVTNSSCLNQMYNCYQNLARHFESVNTTLSQLYSSYLQKLLALEEAKINLTRATTNLSQQKEKVALLQSAYTNANTSYNINLNSNHSLIEKADLYQPFVSYFNSPSQPRLLDVLQITNVSFNIEITNATPVLLPVIISYRISATGLTQNVGMSINFLQPRKYILRHISNRILESYLSVIRSTNRVKRDTIESGTLARDHKFHDTCIELQTLKSYVSQILSILNDSKSHYETSTNILNSNNNNTTLQYSNISSTITTQYESLKTDLNSHYKYLVRFLKNNSFAIWQSHLEIIHVMVSHIETFGCSSFLDCLGTSANLYEQILEDTPNSEQNLNELKNLKKYIYQVGYNKSLTFEEGRNILMNYFSILSLPEVSQYWCIKPPIIIRHPSPVYNVIRNTSITLTCQANSSGLQLKYYWTKSHVIMVNSNSHIYNLINVQMEDQGSYRCVAVNDAGSSTSLPAVVNVMFKPYLNVTLPLTKIAYEGHYNSIDLLCDSIGWPVPGWKWFYRQTPTDAWHQINDANTNILTLNTPQLKDRGWYQCMAYNDIGNATSDPMYLNIIPTAVPKMKYTITLTLSGMRQDSLSALINTLQSNISSTISYIGNPLSSFGEEMSLLSIYLQAPMINISSSMQLMANNMTLSVSTLERDRNTLNTLLLSQGNNNNNYQFNLEKDNEQITVSVVNYAFGPRTFECPSGFEIDTNHLLCVACSPGSYGSSLVNSFLESGNEGYIEELSSQCTKCPLGTYQENGGQSSCQSCPSGYTTTAIGSVEQSNCQKLCSPHTYSSTGLQPCIDCPIKHYQLYTGQRLCVPCDNTTAGKIDACSVLVSATSFVSSSSLSSFSSLMYSTSVQVTSITTATTTTTTTKSVQSSFINLSRTPLPSAIGDETASGFLGTTTYAIIGGSVLLVILIAVVCIVIVSLRIKKKKLHSRELRGLRQAGENHIINYPSVELNSYDTRSCQSAKSSEGGYDDIKGDKLGEISDYMPMSPIHDPIYESLEDVETEKRDSLWGPPPSLPPLNNASNSIWLDKSIDGPAITDEYVNMSRNYSGGEQQDNYQSINS